jgi:hypothetical protein
MSHDTHGASKENKTIISFKNAFWLVVIIVGLFIAALSFIKAESGGEEEGKGEGKEKTEMSAGKEHEGEKAEKKAEEPKPAEAAATTDTAKKAEK